MQGEVFRQCRAPIQDEPPHVPTISSNCLPHPGDIMAGMYTSYIWPNLIDILHILILLSERRNPDLTIECANIYKIYSTQ